MNNRPIPDQIGRMIPRLGSDHDGEVVATARAIERVLQSAGCDWHDVADALTPSQTVPMALARRDWSEKARFSKSHGLHFLNEAERRFICDMAAMASSTFRREPSRRQIAWLEAIYTKLRREAA